MIPLHQEASHDHLLLLPDTFVLIYGLWSQVQGDHRLRVPSPSHFAIDEDGWEEVAEYALTWATENATKAASIRQEGGSALQPCAPPDTRHRLKEITMLTIRRDSEIHDTRDGGWFRARWHFSFDGYHDPENDNFGAMRVFNDDRLSPGAVWPLHPHRDVEALTYVVEGSFGHEDNVGGAFGPLPAGSVQRMTLGSGALHSERNASHHEPLRFIQIWILPDTPGLTPGAEQRIFTGEDRTNRLLRVVGPEGGEVVKIHQDASVHVTSLLAGAEVIHRMGQGRGAYVYLIDGAASFDGEDVATGDAAKVTDQRELVIRAWQTSELILIDVPMAFEAVGVWRD